MKATIASLLAIAGSAMAAGAADTVNQVLTQIASDIKDFDATIKAYSGDISPLTAATKKIGQTTTSGAQAIASGPDLSLTDAVGITSNVQSLQTSLDGTLADLKSIGDKIANNGQCGTVLEQLSAQGKSASALQDAITSKSPPDVRAVAQQLGGAIGAAIQDTNTFFQKTCANAPSGGPSGGSSGGSSPDMAGHGGSGGHGGSQGGSSGGAAPPAPTSGSSGSKTNKASKTSTVPKPATYTGAANVLTAPFMGALALAVFAL
jgi:hypothetical protein